MRLLNFQVERHDTSADAVARAAEAAGLDGGAARAALRAVGFRPPGAEGAVVRFRLEGAPAETAAAVRGALLELAPGRALEAPTAGDFARLLPDAAAARGYTEHICLYEVLALSLANVPLAAAAPAGALYDLDVANGGDATIPVTVGDLRPRDGQPPAAAFADPNKQVGFVHPGRRVRVAGIAVAAGDARDHARFQVFTRVAAVPDAPRVPEAEVVAASASEEATAELIARRGPLAHPDLSGYLEPAALMDPRAHELKAEMRAAGPAAAAEARAAARAALAALAAIYRAAAERLRADSERVPAAPAPDETRWPARELPRYAAAAVWRGALDADPAGLYLWRDDAGTTVLVGGRAALAASAAARAAELDDLL